MSELNIPQKAREYSKHPPTQFMFMRTLEPRNVSYRFPAAGGYLDAAGVAGDGLCTDGYLAPVLSSTQRWDIWHHLLQALLRGPLMDDPFSAKCGNPPHDSTSSNGKVVQPGLKLSYAQSEVYLGLCTYYSITRPLTDEAITQVMVRPLDCTGAEDHR